MKTIKYLLTAILMVSTGLSAMEPAQNNALVSAKVQAVRDAGSMEADMLGKIQISTVEQKKPVIVPLPRHIIDNIADYAGVSAEAAKEERKKQREKINQVLEQDVDFIQASLALTSGIMSARSLYSLYDIFQHGLPELNTLKHTIFNNVALSAGVGALPLLIYVSAFTLANKICEPGRIIRADGQPRKLFEWDLIRKYPLLYMKHICNINQDFKIMFSMPFVLWAGIKYGNGSRVLE